MEHIWNINITSARYGASVKRGMNHVCRGESSVAARSIVMFPRVLYRSSVDAFDTF